MLLAAASTDKGGAGVDAGGHEMGCIGIDFVPQDIVEAMRRVSSSWDLEVCQERNGGNEYSFLQIFRKTSDGGTAESWRKPQPTKTAAVVRYGAYGDALWASSVLPPLKADLNCRCAKTATVFSTRRARPVCTACHHA